MQRLKKGLTFVVEDGSVPGSGAAPVFPFVQPREIPLGVDLAIPFTFIGSDKLPRDMTGWTILLGLCAPDGTLLYQRSMSPLAIDPAGKGTLVINRADTSTGGAASSPLVGVFDVIGMDPDGLEWRGVEPSAWIPVPTQADPSAPFTGPSNAVQLIGVPALPSPDYNKVIFGKSDGTLVWQQKERATVDFDGTSAQATATWPTFSSRPRAVKVASVETDEVEMPEVVVVRGSITATGCTLQANAPFVGTVEIEIEEKV